MLGLLRELMMSFDPEAPLPGPPDPWASTSTPLPRSGPPYAMTEMIAVEPALAERVVRTQALPGSQASALAGAIRTAGERGEPVVVTGCGTSEHAALGIVELLRDAWRAAGLPGRGPLSEQAFELALHPPSTGLVLGVSHEGATAATNAALEAAGKAGARTALVTVSARSPGAALSDAVVETHELDQGWCHVVGYLSPLLAGWAAAGHLAGRPTDATAARRRVTEGIEAALRAAHPLAAAIAGASRLLVVASGADRPAGRELVLKVEEGSWLPSAFRDLETFLHGHLAATGPDTALVLVLTDPAAREARVSRALGALRAARELGLRSGAILAAEAADRIGPELTPAGRIVLPEAPDLDPPAAALLGTATALQLLSERLARTRGTNPDAIRRDDARYRRAAEAAEAEEGPEVAEVEQAAEAED